MAKNLLFLLIAILGFIVVGFNIKRYLKQSELPQQVNKTWKDMAYANKSAAEKLDIYLPEVEKSTYPVIVHIHGGAFMFGDKADKQLDPILQALKSGFAVVSINYRLSGEAHFPAQIQDVKAAIRFLRANAATFKLDTSRMAVWGGSAGGNLSALAGTSGDVVALEDLSLGNEKQSSRVQAVVDWFGPINFLTMDSMFKVSKKGKADHNALESPESRLWGKAIQTIPTLVQTANPESYITPDDPPFFIEHGSVDKLVPTGQSIHFAEQLTNVLGKNRVHFEILQGADHGTPEYFNSPENVKKVIDFLQTTFE